VTAARAWNALPSSVRSAPSLLQFRRDLKTDTACFSHRTLHHSVQLCDRLRKVSFGRIKHTNKNFIETTKKLFTFDVSTSIRGLHQKKLVLGLLLPVLGATS